MAKGSGQWRRVNRGKGHSYYNPAGELVPGVTTLLKAWPKPGLIDWAARSVAEWAGDHHDELGELSPSQVTRRALQAFQGNRQGAMSRGKSIHELAEFLMKGEAVEVPFAEEHHVDQFLRWVDDFGVQPIAAEAVIVNTEWGYCGTSDLLCWMGDQLALVDYKTGSSGIWPETALQLAGYAWADSYLDPVTDELRPMPLAPQEPVSEHKPEGTARFDVVAALYLQDDKYELVPCDVGPGTWQAFLYVAQTARFMETARDTIGDPLPVPARKEEVTP